MPVVRVQEGERFSSAEKRAQKLADRTGRRVEIHERRRTSEGRGGYYWAFAGDVSPSKRNGTGSRRVRKALKKYVKGQLAKKKNPPRSKSRNYEVSIPASRGDRGYLVKIKAPSAASAKAAARKYCAGRQGVPVSKYKLPRGTKARVV
jgi:hypothetical protein